MTSSLLTKTSRNIGRIWHASARDLSYLKRNKISKQLCGYLLQYGYRLPENDDGMLYYQVYFKLIGSQLFTYPEVCLRAANELLVLPHANSLELFRQFFDDVKVEFSRVCGSKCEITDQPMKPETRLLSRTEVPQAVLKCL